MRSVNQMKFRELRVQRDRSLAAYSALSHELAEAADDTARLRILYRGLRDLRFAKQPLHPDVANLEPLLRNQRRAARLAHSLFQPRFARCDATLAIRFTQYPRHTFATLGCYAGSGWAQ